MIYEIKLKNLLNAHQSIYAKLSIDNQNDFQKHHLRKLLGQIQREIEKLIIRKNDKQMDKMKKIHTNCLQTSRVLKCKSNNEKHFFIRKNFIKNQEKKIKQLEMKQLKQSNYYDNDLQLLLSQKANQTSQINESINIDKIINNDKEQDQDSDHSSSNDEQQIVDTNLNDDDSNCNGHGKSASEKDEFIKILNLINRNDLEVMVNNKKTTRKRRTTANPQFSHAAIEAKRITKLEIAQERYRKRIAASQIMKNNSNSSDRTINRYDYLKSLNIFKQANEIFPGLFNVTIELNDDRDNDCKLCKELCNFCDDTIVVCHKCLSLYHVICLERQHLMNSDDWCHQSNRIQCFACQPTSKYHTTSNMHGEKMKKFENYQLKIIKMQQQILLSSNALNCLEHLLNRKQLQQNQCLDEVNELLKWNENFDDLSNRLSNLIDDDESTTGAMIIDNDSNDFPRCTDENHNNNITELFSVKSENDNKMIVEQNDYSSILSSCA